MSLGKTARLSKLSPIMFESIKAQLATTAAKLSHLRRFL